MPKKKETKSSLALWIANKRRTTKLTMAIAAHKSGLKTAQAWNNIESGRCGIPMHHVKGIAKTLTIPFIILRDRVLDDIDARYAKRGKILNKKTKKKKQNQRLKATKAVRKILAKETEINLASGTHRQL